MDNISKFQKLAQTGDIQRAIAFQLALSESIAYENGPDDIRTICAFDISYDKATRTNFAAAVVMSYPELKTLETATLFQEAIFPYVPGLLAFREGPAILDLFKRLKTEPGLLLFDGHGLAHPRGMGIATMIGILLEKPSIGCGKTRLVGEYVEPAATRGSVSKLLKHGRIIGNVLRTRDNIKPVFVSIGHKFDLQKATSIILNCCTKYRLPEPIRTAHRLANEIRMKFNAIDVN